MRREEMHKSAAGPACGSFEPTVRYALDMRVSPFALQCAFRARDSVNLK